MLKRVGKELNTEGAITTMGEAHFPAPFQEGLEYSSPARGNWNIVHTGMLIPESHQIFVCAQGCLRGVVLTAAEMNALDRYSAIQIREENVLDGGMEELMIEGVADVIAKLKYRPKAILLFISCQHFFLAYDQQMVFETLRQRFPDIKFADCYMIPTLRKSGLTPDQKMRIQMYSMWEDRPKKARTINHIGSNLPIAKTCEMVQMIQDGGYEFRDIYGCETFEDYMNMSTSAWNLVYEPMAIPSAKELKKRLGQQDLYMTFTFSYEELEENYEVLAAALEIPKPDFTPWREWAETALKEAKALIGDTPIALDYTFTFRILSFARLLLEHGFSVTEIYADSFLPEERENFEWIQEHYPEIRIGATNRPKMRFLYHREEEEKILAIGQKAAYFTETDYFVNVAESGGYYGYDGIVQIAELMKDAFLNKTDRKVLIQKKGYGCESCI